MRQLKRREGGGTSAVVCRHELHVTEERICTAGSTPIDGSVDSGWNMPLTETPWVHMSTPYDSVRIARAT